MKEYLKQLPKELQDLIYLAGNLASKNNIPIYLVGGFVRDLILDVDNFDLDIVVEGDGIRFAEDLSHILKARLITHGRFGTATLILKNNLKIDIATARIESYPYPASLPVVSPGSLRDDLARRDFTINALAINITQRNLGKLIDFFNARYDLVNKNIRILHNLSFIDDPTRILRAIRFATRYNFKIEPQTLALLKEAVRLKMLEKVKPQRLRDELNLILKEENPLKEIKCIEKLIGFSFIHPCLTLTKSSYKLLGYLKDKINWFIINYPKRRAIDAWLIYLMGLMDSLNINEVRAICKKFAFRRGEEKRILSYKGLKRNFIWDLKKVKIKPSKIFNLLEPLSYEVIILLKAKYTNRNIHRHIEDFFEIYNGMCIFISGEDLNRLGVVPGPYYRKLFTRVLKAKLEGLVKTKEEELELLSKLIRNKWPLAS